MLFRSNAVGNFQKILVDFRCVRPPVKTTADLLDDSLVPEGIEALRGQTASYRLGVGKDGGEFLVERNYGSGTHR